MDTPDHGPRLARFALVLAGVFAALLPLLFHTQYWNGESILYSADTAQLQFPRYKILCDTLQEEGVLPAWQTWLYTGSPFHANPENPTLYPPIVILASFLSPGATINATILLHLSLAALGAFFLVRRLWTRLAGDRPGAEGAGVAGGLVAAAVFSMAYWTRADHLNLVAYGAAHALIPWVLLAADALLYGRRPLAAAGLLGLLLGFLVLTGGLYIVTYLELILAGWMLCLGLLGGRERARRTLVYGPLAIAVAALLVAGKAIPYLEWVPSTNRGARLDYAEALGTVLARAPDGSWRWIEVWNRVEMYTFKGLSLALALLALPLLRHGVVRLAFGLAILCFLIGLGGPVHRFFYDWVPLFDQTRSAVRAWTGVNAMLPILAGLGAAAIFARGRFLATRPAAGAGLGAAVALALAPAFSYSFRHEENFKHPQRLSELPGLYHRWPRVAELCGTQWRAMYVDRDAPHSRNEQFISTMLEVETPAGYLGHVWPRELERHLYGGPRETLSDEIRFRRRSTLSVKWMISNVRGPDAEPLSPGVLPGSPTMNVDGTKSIENPIARARAVAPSVVLGVFGDVDCEAAYAVLDQGTFPLMEAAVVQFPAGRVLSREELAALDGVVICGPPSPGAAAAAESLRARPLPPGRQGVRALKVELPLDEADRAALLALEHELALDALERTEEQLAFERLRSSATRVARNAVHEGGDVVEPPRGRFVVVSEPWSLYPGWTARGASGRELAIERADGASSAVFLPADEKSLVAEYAPRSIRLGLWIHAAGLLLGAALLLFGARARPG